LVTILPSLSQTKPDPDPWGTSKTSRVNASCLNTTPHVEKLKEKAKGSTKNHSETNFEDDG